MKHIRGRKEISEALSVVSEDQSVFDCSYGVPHPPKTEMTASSASEYGQTVKLSPRVQQQDWIPQPAARVKIECNASHINSSRWVLLSKLQFVISHGPWSVSSSVDCCVCRS
ncbi:hypothetical protein JZ751_002358 [Albula glossodonta]|uniref:Uncharacterized protein n=1 Tax=Albula glossodonta TaxID=121402 RepID=A0A8T2P9K2_9TELE|nr:hypothetical protein JZ751_002358 [Albula glossodonta]